jgi:hypothetical protein
MRLPNFHPLKVDLPPCNKILLWESLLSFWGWTEKLDESGATQMTGDSQLQKAGNHLLCVATNIIFLHHVAREVSEMLVQHTFNSFQLLGLCLVGSWASNPFHAKNTRRRKKMDR